MLTEIYNDDPYISKKLWHAIDPKYKYAAMDKRQRIYFYENKPTRLSTLWSATGGEYAVLMANTLFNIDATNIDWKKSLLKRPED